VTGQRPHRGARIKLYYKRMQRVRIRKKKKGLPLEIYGF
jgi:hypothetical protein